MKLRLKNNARGKLLLGLVFLLASVQPAAAFVGLSANSGLSLFGTGVLCVRGDGVDCDKTMVADSSYRRILILPSGFEYADYEDFHFDFNQFVRNMSLAPGILYSTVHASKILYVGFWIASPPLNDEHATFHARIMPHPIRGKALSLDQSMVFDLVSSLSLMDANLFNPWAVAVLFNSPDTDVTANASPPSFIQKPYGIARITSGTVHHDAYVSVHELAHAALNFVDEYTEPGLENMSINTLDHFTPLALLDGSWGGWVNAVRNVFGVYTYRLSEILASNGNDNMDVTRFPSRVYTSGYTSNNYEYESGMFFGKGTYHDQGKNLMNDDSNAKAADDGFAFAHSRSQQGVVDMAFAHPNTAARPNDRLRAVGPFGSWRFEWGSTTHLLLFDADKNHRYQPTKKYEVQVGWWNRNWHVCWGGGFFPYPCYNDEWVTMQKEFFPAARNIRLEKTALYGMASTAQSIACHLGITSINAGSGHFELCTQGLDEISSSFLPTLLFSTPYQDVAIPASQWMTKYFWRFRTANGTYTSGWTGWSSFTRAL